MRKPSFAVTTITVAAVVIVGVARRVIEPVISRANTTWGERQTNPLALQFYRWKSFNQASLDEAKRKQKPVLLFFAAPYSRFTEQMEDRVFSDPELLRFLDRNFVGIRIDLGQNPEWETAYLPLLRTQAPVLSDLALVVTDAEGRLIDGLPATSPTYVPGSGYIQTFLRRARNNFGRYRADPTGEFTAGVAQAQDINALKDPSGVYLARCGDFLARFRGYIDPTRKLVIYNGMVRVAPSAWLLAMKGGFEPDYQEGLEALLKSSLHDWVDGGFFRTALLNPNLEVDCSKRLHTSAAMLEVLAVANILNPTPLSEYSYRRTLEAVKTDFQSDEDTGVCRVSDQAATGISPRGSLTQRKINAVEDSAARQWIRANLVDRPDNPFSMGTFTGKNFDPDLAAKYMGMAQKVSGERPSVVARSRLDVTLYAVAKVLTAARLRKDQPNLDWAARKLDGVLQILPKGDLPTFLFGESKFNYLGGYLAVADACLQDFLVTGRYASLQTGQAVLDRAIERFWTSDELFVAGVLPPGIRFRFTPAVPELADLESESLSAQGLRMLKSYSRIFYNTGTGKGYVQKGNVLMTKLSGALDKGGLPTAGFFCAAAEYCDDAYAVTVGPDAVELGNELARKVPTRFVFPAVGDVRADLDRKKPGIYLVKGATTVGPLSLDGAVNQLTSKFDLR